MVKRSLALLALPLTLALSGCYDEGGYYAGADYPYGGSYPYYGWYDGYYGDIYDGYWGRDNYFYYRQHPDDHGFVRGDRNHFMRNAPGGGRGGMGGGGRGGGNFHELRGNFQPKPGDHPTNFPRGGGAGRGGGNRGGNGMHSTR